MAASILVYSNCNFLIDSEEGSASGEASVEVNAFCISNNCRYKASYRTTNGFDNIDGANYDLALWVAYYNFLRPHKHNNYKVLNKVDELSNANSMPGKWQLLIYLGQQTILNLQKAEGTNCSHHLHRRQSPYSSFCCAVKGGVTHQKIKYLQFSRFD